MIHIYTGGGKGKTTLAMGMGLRAKSAKKRVFAVQFLNSVSDNERKEIPFEIHKASNFEKEYGKMTDDEKEFIKSEVKKAFTLCKLMCKKSDMLIMDEIFYCIEKDFIKEEELTDFIDKLPKNCELILTGANVPQSIIDKSDCVYEINCVKEP